MLVSIKKLYTLISKDRFLEVSLLVVLILFMTLLEMAGISLIIPLVSLLSNKEGMDNSNNFIVNMSEHLNFMNQDIIIITCIFLICFFVFKFLSSIFAIFYQEKFIANLKKDLHFLVFKKSLLKPFDFHLYKNSSELLALNTREVDFISSSVSNFALIVSEVFVSIGIFILLLYIAPYPTLFICFSLSLIGFSLNYFSKKKIFKLGEKRIISSASLYKVIQQGLLGIKDIKIINRENFFINKIIEPITVLAKVDVIMTVIQSLPRLVFELLFVLSILVLVIFLSKDLENIIPTLALFAGACFRLLPSANRIITNIQGIFFGIPSINKIYDLIIEDSYIHKSEINKSKFIFKESINIENLSFQYKASKDIIKSANLIVKKNEFIGIVGKTGVGKSTLVNLIIGLLKSNSGSIKVDNKNIELFPKLWMRNIGYVPQEVYLLDESLKNNIALGIKDSNIDLIKINEIISECDLNKFVSNLPDGVNSILGERGLRISGGERQRIGIARAIYRNPSILIFDESTSSLDYSTEKEILDSLMQFKDKRTIIFISHRKEALKNCNKIYELKNCQLHLL